MGKTRIGETVVANGGSVKWGVVASIIIGAPVYAYFEGLIGLVHGFREFLIVDLLGGVRSWAVTLIDLEFVVAEVAVETAWWEFWSSVRGAGVFAWLLSVIGFALVLLLLFVLVSKGVSALV